MPEKGRDKNTIRDKDRSGKSERERERISNITVVVVADVLALSSAPT